MKKYPRFDDAVQGAMSAMRQVSTLVHTEKWQGVDITSKPEMATHEILNHSFQVPIWTENLGQLANDIKPNMPWADNHFDERVCGFPLNPGTEWANWPYGKSAANFLENGIFNHSYAERYWPKYAGCFKPMEYAPASWKEPLTTDPHRGIREDYGDLRDVVNQLIKEPLTRQAILPIFFPEDTGGAAGGRVPCSLHYQFIMRGGYLHMIYALRSCDLVRHFRDDIYLTVRLLLWVLDQLRMKDDGWRAVKPGMFTMHIVSLHCFRNDYQAMFGRAR